MKRVRRTSKRGMKLENVVNRKNNENERRQKKASFTAATTVRTGHSSLPKLRVVFVQKRSRNLNCCFRRAIQHCTEPSPTSVERACDCVALQVCFLAHRGPQDTNPFPQSCLNLAFLASDTHNDGKRIPCARVRHGLLLAIPSQLLNGSSASLCKCSSERVEQLSRTPDTKKSCQQLSKQHQKITEPLCTTPLFSPKAKVDRNL